MRFRHLVVPLYAAAALVLTWPFATRFGSHLPAVGTPYDALLHVFLLGWGWHGLTTHPLAVFDAPIFHPEARTLTYMDHMLGEAVLAGPIIEGFGLGAAYNSLIILSFVASAYCVYRLARLFGTSRSGSAPAPRALHALRPSLSRQGRHGWRTNRRCGLDSRAPRAGRRSRCPWPLGRRPAVRHAGYPDRHPRGAALPLRHAGEAAEQGQPHGGPDTQPAREDIAQADLRRSLTWDRGLEMADHKRFSIDSDLRVYFCDPQSPWQRGSNENTNGLLRQYFTKGSDLSRHSQAHLNKVALQLNQRLRDTLGFDTPANVLHGRVASTGRERHPIS